jgi:hypothetical protein
VASLPPRVPRLACALALIVAVASDAAARERYVDAIEPPRYEPYSADAQPPVRVGMPEDIELLRSEDSAAWPESLEAELVSRARAEWPAAQTYGPLFANIGVTLRWPLVTAEAGGRVTLPVVDGLELPIEGALTLARTDGPRRVVVLVDASASANATSAFGADATSGERVSVLEAERRALDHLVDMAADDWLELGVIAFGETTWPVAEPGLSADALRTALATFRRDHPRGEGRTDAVCALWTARDWLDSTPDGVAREIVVLTDGDAPFSGRFLDCDGEGRGVSDEAEAACVARRNPTICPAEHRFTRADGSSDMVQLASFARHARGEIAVHPLLFETDRNARLWQQIAARTGGRLVRVPGPEAIELALPALVSSRILGVVARNLTSGVASGDLLQADRAGIRGALALVPGANDVELRVESDRGAAALFRFRIHAAPRQLERWLAELRERNGELALRAESLEAESAELRDRRRERTLELDAEAPPAAPSASP